MDKERSKIIMDQVFSGISKDTQIEEVIEMIYMEFPSLFKKQLKKLKYISKKIVLDIIDDLSCCQAPNVCQCCENLEDLKKDVELL